MNHSRRVRSRIGAVAAIVLALALGSPGTASAGDGAEQTFRLLFTADPTQTPGRVIATGRITAVGTVQVTGASDGQLLASYVFPRGTLSVAATPLGGSFDPDLTSCTARATSTSRVDVLGGTGSYTGASGTGMATASAFLVGERGLAGECLLAQRPPARGVEMVTVRATLSLPGET